MARTPLQIEDAMIASTQTIDPGIDATKGPHRAAFIQPQAQQLSQTEQLIDDMSLRYSLRYILARNPAIMDLYAANHSLLRGEGSPSRTPLVFFTVVVPAAGGYVFIPAGTVATSRDGTISFQTELDLTIPASAFPIYFNSDNRRYEFTVWAKSIGVGPQFEIAAGRLTVLQTPIDGISGVAQPLRSSPSSQVESNLQLGQRQQSAFVGTAIGTPAGIESAIRNFDPTNILDVGVVYSTEYGLFRRPLRRPGFDIWIVGAVQDTWTETFRAAGGELSFRLSKQPVLNLNTIVINGQQTTAVLVRDTLPATQNSVRANDSILLQSPAEPGSTIQVSYTYNKLLNDISDYILRANPNQRYWKADILIRGANVVPVSVNLDIQALSSIDTQSIISTVQQATTTYINKNLLNVTYFPSELAQAINGTTAGISSVRVVGFTRLDQGGVLPVDVVETNRTEYAFITLGNLTINVSV